MVVLLTPAAVGSRWVKREIEYALGAKNFSNCLISVVVDDREGDSRPSLINTDSAKFRVPKEIILSPSSVNRQFATQRADVLRKYLLNLFLSGGLRVRILHNTSSPYRK